MQTLRAGPLTVEFDNGDLRGVCCGATEALQRIYFAVRDPEWGTLANAIGGLRISDRGDSFEIRYDAENREGDIHFKWSAVILGTADGEITFTMAGAAQTSFLKNRVGICVLHPAPMYAGRPCTVEFGDGRVQQAEFPRFVAPHQPFLDVRAVTHEVEPGVSVEVTVQGDFFEMEDQRNWTDSSFKTYSTRLALPFPARMEAGTEVRQTVRVRVHGTPSTATPQPAPEIDIELSGATRPLPPIGLAGAADTVLDVHEAAEFRRLRLGHLRADLRTEDVPTALEIAAANAGALGVELECAVARQELLSACVPLRASVARWLVWPEMLAEARRHLGAAFIAAGSDANFAELNRNRPDPAACDGLWFALNPQIHACDERSMVENLRAQADAVESAHRFAGGRPVFVSPVTLKQRFHADPRQSTPFAAAWTLGSIRYLAGAGAAGITYYELRGPRGVLGFPIFDLLAKLAEFAGGEVALTRSSHPLQVEALALIKGSRRALFLSNFTALPLTVRFDGRSIEAQPGVTALDLR